MHSLIISVRSHFGGFDIPPISPNFSGPGSAAAIQLSGQAAGLGLIVLGALFIIFAVIFGVSFSTHSNGLRMTGGVGMLCAVVAAAFIASAAGFINFGSNVNLAP